MPPTDLSGIALPADRRAPLPRSFFARPALRVARECIGKILVRRSNGTVAAGRIVESEAYVGPRDRAAHSYGGRRTPRTEVMFGTAGHAYVFRIYGMHWHFNLVTGKQGHPEAVLLRAIEPVIGVDVMAERRGMSATHVALTNGPGKLCKALAITGADYGADLCGSSLYLADGRAPRRVARSPRIGVDYAGEWALRPYRFFDADSRHVSRPRSS